MGIICDIGNVNMWVLKEKGDSDDNTYVHDLEEKIIDAFKIY